MDSWDVQPGSLSKLTSLKDGNGKWEGEDDDEDVMESWDQDDEEQKSDTGPTKEAVSKKIPNGKSNLKKLVEKFEDKQKKKKLDSFKKIPETSEIELEDQIAEKLRRQKLQEESDLALAREVFGALGKASLESKEDFDSLKNEVLKLTSDAVKNANFAAFTEEIVNALAVHLSSVDLKRIHTRLGNLHIEKSKLEKGDKVKKPKCKVKAKLKMESGAANEFLHSGYADYDQDFDDFI
ncbi:Eukaryotic translation initiation factor 3 subunit G-1 [Nesidiocoris tenuis]|uniref:Eukaryotic translation initiation factor 3 subunit G-1 n=1 Tax=Nesidiocoris tenuis TaxID=355587 RepID=A0ABN7ASF7_9HEMI|nr:Eukaryotic translation initiation factor 3 subunit G-1 [Nesidiocoris tenuis]